MKSQSKHMQLWSLVSYVREDWVKRNLDIGLCYGPVFMSQLCISGEREAFTQ